MLTLTQLRNIDPKFAHISDEQLEAIRTELYETAQLAFELWNEETDSSKNPLGLLPPKQEQVTIPLKL